MAKMIAKDFDTKMAELHRPKTVRFVDDDGAQHAPVQVCSTCNVRWPCSTLALVEHHFGASSDPSDSTTQGQLPS